MSINMNQRKNSGKSQQINSLNKCITTGNTRSKNQSVRSERKENLANVSGTSVSGGRKSHSDHKSVNLVVFQTAKKLNSISNKKNTKSVTSTQAKADGWTTVSNRNNRNKTVSKQSRSKNTRAKKHPSRQHTKTTRTNNDYKKSHRSISSVVNQWCKLLTKHAAKSDNSKDPLSDFCMTCGFAKKIGAGKMNLLNEDGDVYTVLRGSTASQQVAIMMSSSKEIRYVLANAMKVLMKQALGIILIQRNRQCWVERNKNTDVFTINQSPDDGIQEDITPENVYNLLEFIVKHKKMMLRNCKVMFDTITPINVDKTNPRASFDDIVCRLFAEVLEIGANNVDFNSIAWCGFPEIRAKDFFFPTHGFALPTKNDIIAHVNATAVLFVEPSNEPVVEPTNKPVVEPTNNTEVVNIIADSSNFPSLSKKQSACEAPSSMKWGEVAILRTDEEKDRMDSLNRIALRKKVEKRHTNACARNAKNNKSTDIDREEHIKYEFLMEMSRNVFDEDHVLDESAVMDTAIKQVRQVEEDDAWENNQDAWENDQDELIFSDDESDYDKKTDDEVDDDWEDE